MKKAVFNSILLLISLWIGSACTAQSIEKLSPKDFQDRINTETSSFEILDVRTDKEYAQGKIKGARQLNFYDDDFSSALKQMDKKKTYYIYCAVGGRSGKAVSKMLAMGFKNIYDLDGGMTAWKAAGLDIE